MPAKLRAAAPAALVLMVVVPAAALAQEPQLYGRWRAVETRVQLADGSTNKQGGSCTAEYDREKTVSECDMGEGRKSRVVARLSNVTPTSYEIEVVEASAGPRAVGMRNKVDYRIEGNRMVVSAKPAASGTSVSLIETTLVRE
jgi:hypothetical protein